MELDIPLVSAVLLSLYLIVSLIKNNRRRGGPLPPGPSGLPILGNALDMSGAHPWIKYTEWSRQYGDVVHFSAAGQSVIVLSSRKALFDLLEQRGSIYSDRPRLVMSGELAGYVDSVPLTPYGNRHREYRKLMSEALTAKKAQDYYVLEEEKAREYLVDLLKTPEDFLSHTRRTVAAIVFMITHGHELTDGKDHLMELAERTDDDFSESSVPGAFMVDVFPILTYLPRWLGFDWMKKEKQYQKNRDAFLNEPYETVKRQVAQGTAIPSFVSSLIERNKNASAAQEHIFKWVSGGFYAGGADTSVSAIASFFLAMSLYPEVQRKAQEEIHRVVGPTRLPGFSDRSQLPYLEALMYEVHRWNPVGPTAIPHRVTKDDAYNGYLIPAGSIIIPNSWGVLHDPALYPDPFEFIPERYLNAAANGEDGINPDPRKFAFGYGRRVCPGQYLADNSLFIAMVMVLSVFDIHPVDKEAKRPDFSRSEGYTSGVICHPEHFQCRIVPRSADAVALITSSDPKERH